ncbi:MAG TPA: hypothetical protein VLC46_18880 [Thermoanaerobaculia bacterium]|jgi:hypothetical protein|nr:hypothetical protein [Thermoanaerobaculia bacterium]
MHKSRLFTVLLTITLLSSLCSAALGQTKEPLNTGYDNDNPVPSPYTAVISATSNTNDNYWINIASYPPTLPPAPAPSWVLKYPGLPWALALPKTNWISARPTVGSPGTVSDPAYTIFRKCFCMLQAYTQPALTFTVRADDTVQVWFNTQLNVALPASDGHYNTTVLNSLPSNPNWFRPGSNCIYVLVENLGGWMGFDMEGIIQAYGLMPGAAEGAAQQFACPCTSGPNGPKPPLTGRGTVTGDDEVVNALKQIAERRRLARIQQRPPQ